MPTHHLRSFVSSVGPAAIRSAVALLTASVVLAVACANVRPHFMSVPEGLLPVVFGICLTVFVSIDFSCRRGIMHQSSMRFADIRRSSRLVFLWLYLLVGTNELAAWWSDYSYEAAADKLSSFLIAGIAVLIFIRISAAAVRTPTAY